MLGRFKSLREDPVKAFDVSSRLGSIVPVAKSSETVRPSFSEPKRTSALLPAEVMAPSKSQSAFHLIDPSNSATKSTAYSQYVQDFIYSTGQYSQPYSDPQLEMAFWTSTYLFAALRRVSNLISRVKVVAEVKNGDTWQRLPETSNLNEILARDMPTCLKIGYLNYAIYGKTLTYKTKTRRAMMARSSGNPIYGYMDGAVGGLLVLDNPGWQINQTSSSGYNTLKGVFVNYDYKDILGDQNYLDRREFVYITDWNPRDKNNGRSIAAVAIHEAVTNAAIARWASEYFTRGTLPMLLVSMVDNPAVMTQSDLAKQKRFFEDQYQGQAASLRSVFVDQKVDVNEIGITADRVAAPELNKNALEGISAAVGIERDLIIAPEGGTQGRHRTMVQQAWNDTIIPLAEGFCAQYRQDLGLPDSVRLQIDVSHISELEADRGDRSTAELSVFEKSVQSLNETRLRLNQKPIPQLKNFFMVNGILQSVDKILAMDKLLDDKAWTQVTGAWDSDLILKSEALGMMGRKLRPGEKDGYKSELVGVPGGDSLSQDPPESEPPDEPPNTPPDPTPPTQPESEVKSVDEGEIEQHDEDEFDILLAGFEDEKEDDDDDAELLVPEAAIIETPKDMSIFVSIPLTNDSTIIEMKRKLARGFKDQDGISWKKNESLHLTLVFADDISDEALTEVIKLIPELTTPLLSIGPLVCFEQEKRTVVTLEVTRDQRLQALQQSIVSAFQAYGIEMSHYSEISGWTPHITLCEVEPGTEIPDFNYRAKIEPSIITFTRTNDAVQSFIKLKPNSFDANVTIDEHYMDLLEKRLKEKRKELTTQIISWKDGNGPGKINSKIVDWINEYIDRADVFSSAIQANESGMFDEDNDTIFNPLEKFLRGIQKTAEEELSAWKRVAKSNPSKAKLKFQVSKLPTYIEDEVRKDLTNAVGSSPAVIDPIFTKAFAMLEEDSVIRPTSHDHLSTIYDRLSSSEDPDLKSLTEGM